MHALNGFVLQSATRSSIQATSTNMAGGYGDYNNQYMQGGGAQGGYGMQGGLNDTQRMILDVIKHCPQSEGANFQYMEMNLRSILPMEIRYVFDACLMPCHRQLLINLCYSRQVEFLSSEGHLYSTIDEEHYKAAD
jgi:hypothetical protein